MVCHTLCKQQQSILSVAQVCAALPSRQLLINATQLGVHSLHACAELAQPFLLQLLPLLLQPVVTKSNAGKYANLP